jgi:hypothetical protein
VILRGLSGKRLTSSFRKSFEDMTIWNGYPQFLTQWSKSFVNWFVLSAPNSRWLSIVNEQCTFPLLMYLTIEKAASRDLELMIV